jgi:phosphotriesterase-related protein
MKKINTVTGAVKPEELGFTLPHEHLMVDFIGAEQASPDRYNNNEVVKTMLPYLNEVKALGVNSFIDCTPPYLGRDPEILKELSEKSGIKILTCTGIYNKHYIPAWAEKASVKDIADFITKEGLHGCDDTGILPGFIKTAVMPDKLTETEKKLITAAARASLETGLIIGTHTGKADPAGEILNILKAEGLPASRWIYIHAQNEDDNTKLLKIAESGCYIELDGLAWGGDENHLTKLLALKEAGFLDQVLMSQDAGWYRVGEPAGGEKKGFSRIITEFMPFAKEKGISDEDFDRIFRINPARAFAV